MPLLTSDLRMPSHAKINLGLYVLGKRPDGYHDIWTIFQELEFHDVLYFTKRDAPLTLTTNHPTLPVGDENLVCRAARAFAQKTGCPTQLAIHLEKQIPLGAGLGGGSSNAAAALCGLNQLFQVGASREELAALGATLGSDVPFFLHGGTAIGTGRGEQIEPMPDLPPCWILLINPRIHVSSAWAYKNINLKLTNFPTKNNVFSQQHNAVTDALRTLENMLEEPVISHYPIIASIKNLLLEEGAEWASMSGSGSTVFGVFKEKELAEQALRQIERPDWLLVVTSFHQRTSSPAHA